MELTGVRVELPTNQPIVLLRERDGERYLPIWIGASEAAAIALSLQGVVTPRPMTHDLIKTILEDLSVDVQRIVVTELRDATFFATIQLQRSGEDHEVSSRPSDAIALAVRLDVPIRVNETVMARAAIRPSQGIENAPEEVEEKLDAFRDALQDLDRGIAPCLAVLVDEAEGFILAAAV